MQETDGVLYALTRNLYGIELPELRKFTPDTLSALESDVCTSEITGLGLRADGRLLMGNSEELFAYDTGSGETETLVRWQEIGANVLTEQPWELEDGYLLFSPGDTSLQRLRRVPGQAPERTVLTLAVVCGDTPFGAFTQMLQDFNLSQDAYRIDWTLYTDSQYADDMEEFMGSTPEDQCMVVVDPSAASFIAELRSRGVYVKPANNEVEDGIRVVGSLLAKRNIRINKENCKGLLGEMRSYVWDDKAAERGEEKPVKQKDHGPDALRYYCYTVLPKWRIGA